MFFSWKAEPPGERVINLFKELLNLKTQRHISIILRLILLFSCLSEPYFYLPLRTAYNREDIVCVSDVTVSEWQKWILS